MRRTLLMTGMLVAIAVGGGAWVSAETAPPAKARDRAGAPPAPTPGAGAPACNPLAGGMMGNGMMGGGMMGGGMMGMPMGPMAMGMMGGDTKVEVKNVDKGVTITITSTDPARVKRLQKMAEAMRLMHEANSP